MASRSSSPSTTIPAITPNAEIIVVDDGSADDTPSVAALMGMPVVALAENSGPAAARNEGAGRARGAILFFVDADVVIAPRAIERVQGTHLKRWTLGSIVRADIAQRALPWSRLILESGHAPDDLNLTTGQRVSAGLV
ncbi:MAG TPA: glycosyltransferase family 2 protein, partial [bacterium]|nr:glycosyltransferase family 2 protein [bacterium]